MSWVRPGVREVRASELRSHRDDGAFAAGSMGPKIDAALYFLEHGGKRAIIAHLDDAVDALDGRAGTLVLPD